MYKVLYVVKDTGVVISKVVTVEQLKELKVNKKYDIRQIRKIEV